MWAPAFPGQAVLGLYFRAHGGDTRSVLGWARTAWWLGVGKGSFSWLFSTRPDMTPLLHCSFSIRDRFTNSEILTSLPQTFCHLASDGLAQFKKIKYAKTWMQGMHTLAANTTRENSARKICWGRVSKHRAWDTYSDCGRHKERTLAFPGAVGARSVELKHGNPVSSVYLESFLSTLTLSVTDLKKLVSHYFKTCDSIYQDNLCVFILQHIEAQAPTTVGRFNNY